MEECSGPMLEVASIWFQNPVEGIGLGDLLFDVIVIVVAVLPFVLVPFEVAVFVIFSHCFLRVIIF